MNTLKIIGLVGAGAALLALVGGGIWYWRQRKKKTAPRIIPSNPPRRVDPKDQAEPTDQAPKRAEDTRPRGHMVTQKDLNPALKDVLNGMFDKGWPPTEEVINNLETDDVIVFAAESEETGNYTVTQQELVTAKVLSVGISEIRARVFGEVEHAEHLGSHAGHGYRVGDLVEVPRSKVLVAARRTDADKTGYGSKGEPAQTFKPSNETKKVYRVRPDTPYDLILPYRTKELVWHLDKDLVKVVHVGDKGLIEQISFTEDSLRGDVSLRALDEDPEVGTVFVARWDFELDA